MNAELQRRWIVSEPPFDGVTLFTPDFLCLPELRLLLKSIVDLLYSHWREEPLLTMADWFEHDGWIKEAEATSWIHLMSLADSDESLKTQIQEVYVRSGYFPACHEFLLRLYIPEDSEQPYQDSDDPDLVDYGVFDLTCSESLAAEVTARIGLVNTLGLEPAKPYFDRCFSG